MTYFVSDIHGEYELFLRLLDEIKFSSSDEIIILGDMIDKGERSVSLVDFIAELPNASVITGNHEYEFLKRYNGIMREFDGNDADCILQKLSIGFSPKDKKISWKTVDFLECLPAYIERENFICVHAGLSVGLSSEILPMIEQDERVLVYDRRFKESSFYLNQNQKTVLFGHTPCSYDNFSGEFIKTPKASAVNPQALSDYSKIRLDCGVYLTGLLGALRLEDMREFYVKKPSL